MEDLSQAQIERTTNRARKILEDKGLEFFIVAGNKNGGASHTKSFSKGSAAAYARKAHTRWEKRHGIDPEHARNKMLGIDKIAASRFDKVFKLADKAKKLRMLKQINTTAGAMPSTKSMARFNLTKAVNSGDMNKARLAVREGLRPPVATKRWSRRVRNGKVNEFVDRQTVDMFERGEKAFDLKKAKHFYNKKADPNGYSYITHGGTKSFTEHVKGGGRQGYPLEGYAHTKGMQVHYSADRSVRDAASKNMSSEYADKAKSAAGYGNEASVVTGRIKNKYLLAGNNNLEAGIPSRYYSKVKWD